MRLFAAALVVFMLAAPVAAQTVMNVARAKVLLPVGQWVVMPAAAGDGLTVIGRLSIEAEVQTAFLVQEGAVRGWVEVTATPRTFGFPLELANNCRASNATLWSRAIEEGNPLDRQCASASAPFDAVRTLQARPALGQAAHELGLALPKELVVASAQMLRQKGLLMHINVFAEPSFVGDDKDLPKNMPSRVNAQHGAYALQLSALVRDCLYSLRCAVNLPALLFADAAAPAPTK
jgi:hypothetical protein